MALLSKDLHLTAEFLAFLRAGFFAQILFEGAASRLGWSSLPSNYVDASHKAFDKLDTWLLEAEDGVPLFNSSWTSPDTFDAINAMGLMKDLKKDSLWLLPLVEQALQVPNLAEDRESVKLLAAALTRSAASRSANTETLYNLFFKLKAEELAQQNFAELPDAKNYLQTAQTIVDIFSTDAPFQPDLCERLRIEASLVPCDIRAHLHDTRIFLNIYARDFSYELAEIPPDHARAWIDRKIPAVAAGYWYAYRFNPDECLRWVAIGVRGAPMAAYWRRAGFEAEAAVGWIQHSIPPMVARIWALAGFDPARTASFLQRGIADPAQAPKNYDPEQP
jgi:hypothetical protein